MASTNNSDPQYATLVLLGRILMGGMRAATSWLRNQYAAQPCERQMSRCMTATNDNSAGTDARDTDVIPALTMEARASHRRVTDHDTTAHREDEDPNDQPDTSEQWWQEHGDHYTYEVHHNGNKHDIHMIEMGAIERGWDEQEFDKREREGRQYIQSLMRKAEHTPSKASNHLAASRGSGTHMS